MREAFILRFSRDGVRLPVPWVNRGWTQGAVLNAEFSTFPRSLRLLFDGADLSTKRKMTRVRRNRDWDKHTFRLRRFSRDNMVGFRGSFVDALPAGRYVISIVLKGFPQTARQEFTIDSGGETIVDIDLEPDHRLVNLNRRVPDFDPEIRRVIEAPESVLDTRAAAAWIEDTSRTSARRACVLNLLAKMRAFPASDPLINHVKHIYMADIDRMYACVTPGFVEALDSGPATQGSVSGTHKKLLHWNKLDKKTYKLSSYREAVPQPSLQCVVATPRRGSGTIFADIDIDEANPEFDVVRFIKHLGELMDGHPTDHIKLHEKLLQDPAKDFLYYDVEEPV